MNAVFPVIRTFFYQIFKILSLIIQKVQNYLLIKVTSFIFRRQMYQNSEKIN